MGLNVDIIAAHQSLDRIMRLMGGDRTKDEIRKIADDILEFEKQMESKWKKN